MRSSEDIVLALPAYLHTLGLQSYAPLPQPATCELCTGEAAVELRTTARVADGLRTRFATVCCARCGLMVQSPRFAPEFYDAYYSRIYRGMVGGAAAPSAAYVADQVDRGAALFDNLAGWLPQTGRLLDVGCGAGGMMQPFVDRGWAVLGIDPDEAATADAAARGLPVVTASAETMPIDRDRFDLILVMGSLEHVRDPHAVLQRCHAAAGEESLLLLEAHGLGQAAHVGAIGHNHRRLLTGTTMALLMLQHGWALEWVTDRPLCGPTRPGSVFALGRRCAVPDAGALHDAIAGGLRDTPEALAKSLDRQAIQ
ncbi:class I SAM-dependent methyltransferase [Sphingomonas sp. PB2P19]|uniref:class I SAM-dependent methyltransferase n=1 Tax=Sphingomonas rhamnosi TaxID=3096156 RepID=UPI002FCC604F